jgi:isocitrate dehydrogenase
MDKAGDYKNVLELCTLISEAGFDVIKTENLCRFDGEIAFSLGQGQ